MLTDHNSPRKTPTRGSPGNTAKMAPSDDWRPYTIPYSGDGAVRRSDGTWVPSSKAHSAPLLPNHQQGFSANEPLAASAPMDTSAMAANDAGGPDSGTYTAAGFSGPYAAVDYSTSGPYTAAGFAAASNGYRGPDIPSIPAQSPLTQGVHPRFAGEKRPGEGIPCAGGNPPAGSCEKRSRAAENTKNAPNGRVKRGE